MVSIESETDQLCYESMFSGDTHDQDLVKRIISLGVDKPSWVQREGWAHISKGNDMVILAGRGTGKTMTYAVSALANIDVTESQCQVLVLAPSRAISQHILKLVSELGEAMKVTSHACVGGTDLRTDIHTMTKGIHMVIGTPGRVHDMLKRKALDASSLKMFVLDQANDILDKGFNPDVANVFKYVPEGVQRLVFATELSPELKELTSHHLRSPITIEHESKKKVLSDVKQYWADVDEERTKFELLNIILQSVLDMATSHDWFNFGIIIYVNKSEKANMLRDILLSEGMNVANIHDDMPQREREVVLREFSTGSCNTMVATDLKTSQSMSHWQNKFTLVINFDVPLDKDSYLERVGQTPCVKALAINLVTEEEKDMVLEMLMYHGTEMTPIPLDLHRELMQLIHEE